MYRKNGPPAPKPTRPRHASITLSPDGGASPNDFLFGDRQYRLKRIFVPFEKHTKNPHSRQKCPPQLKLTLCWQCPPDNHVLRCPQHLPVWADSWVFECISEVVSISLTLRLFTLSRSNSQLILLCTQHCFQSRHVARWMLQARTLPTCQLLPVIADENFQVAKVYQELSSPLADLPDVDRHVYSQVIKATFLELAIPFICSQSSEDDLGIRSRQVAVRLSGNLRRLNAKLQIVGANDSTIEVQVSEPEPSELHQPGTPQSSNASLSMLSRALPVADRSEENILEDIESETISRAFWVSTACPVDCFFSMLCEWPSTCNLHRACNRLSKGSADIVPQVP